MLSLVAFAPAFVENGIRPYCHGIPCRNWPAKFFVKASFDHKKVEVDEFSDSSEAYVWNIA